MVGLHEQAHPFRWLSKDQRSTPSRENLLAQRLALQDRPKHLSQQHATRIHVLQHIQLCQGTFPLTEHTEQLEQQDAGASLRRRFPDAFLRKRQCLIKISCFDAFFSVH